MAASYKKLFKLLIDREMKSKELAALAKVSPATLAKMKKDGVSVNSDVLIKICTALGCTLDDILGGKDTVPIIDGATVANGKVTLDYKKGEFKNVYLTYTTSDDEDSHKWLFFKEKIQAENGAYAADLPAGVTACVIETEVDLNGKIARFSTPMYEVAK